MKSSRNNRAPENAPRVLDEAYMLSIANKLIKSANFVNGQTLTDMNRVGRA